MEMLQAAGNNEGEPLFASPAFLISLEDVPRIEDGSWPSSPKTGISSRPVFSRRALLFTGVFAERPGRPRLTSRRDDD